MLKESFDCNSEVFEKTGARFYGNKSYNVNLYTRVYFICI